MPLGLQITIIIATASFLITVVTLIAKISHHLGKLDSLRDDFNQHREENRDDFNRIEAKLDKLTETVATLVGQQASQE